MVNQLESETDLTFMATIECCEVSVVKYPPKYRPENRRT